MNERPIVRMSAEQLQSRRQTDWRKFDSLTDADIEAAIKDDPDAAPVMDEAFASQAFTVRLVSDEEDRRR